MKEIFKKEYDGESIYDVDRDVSEAFHSEYNPALADLPEDENGFWEGKFTITITWEPEA